MGYNIHKSNLSSTIWGNYKTYKVLIDHSFERKLYEAWNRLCQKLARGFGCAYCARKFLKLEFYYDAMYSTSSEPMVAFSARYRFSYVFRKIQDSKMRFQGFCI